MRRLAWYKLVPVESAAVSSSAGRHSPEPRSNRELQVVPQQLRFNAAVVLAFLPITRIAVAETVISRDIGKKPDDAILSMALRARIFRHRQARLQPAAFCP